MVPGIFITIGVFILIVLIYKFITDEFNPFVVSSLVLLMSAIICGLMILEDFKKSPERESVECVTQVETDGRLCVYGDEVHIKDDSIFVQGADIDIVATKAHSEKLSKTVTSCNNEVTRLELSIFVLMGIGVIATVVLTNRANS